MRLDEASWRGKQGLATLLAALGAGDGMVRFVGGFVRDSLLGEPGKDIDLATVHPPAESLACIRAGGFKAVPTGLAHGTVTAVLPSGPVEVTTLRRDVETDGRHAVVAFTDDWQADAARRDFTFNALSADPGDGRVHDYFGGLGDLREGRVRFIGEPLQRIAEDHLRILRFFRFHARFGRGAPDAAALAACTARANDLMTLSRERIAAELLTLLALADPAPTLALMLAQGILAPVLPEIDANGVTRLQALVSREAIAAIPGHPLRRLAALLPADPPIAEQVAARLKLSNAARERLKRAADPAPPAADIRATAYRLTAEAAVDLLLLRGHKADIPAALARLAGWEQPRLPVTGGDLVALGLPKGPIVAATLAKVRDAWIGSGFPGSEETARIAQAAVDQALRDKA